MKEWAAGKPWTNDMAAEFLKYDLNNDGIITWEEAVRSTGERIIRKPVRLGRTIRPPWEPVRAGGRPPAHPPPQEPLRRAVHRGPGAAPPGAPAAPGAAPPGRRTGRSRAPHRHREAPHRLHRLASRRPRRRPRRRPYPLRLPSLPAVFPSEPRGWPTGWAGGDWCAAAAQRLSPSVPAHSRLPQPEGPACRPWISIARNTSSRPISFGPFVSGCGKGLPRRSCSPASSRSCSPRPSSRWPWSSWPASCG